MKKFHLLILGFIITLFSGLSTAQWERINSSSAQSGGFLTANDTSFFLGTNRGGPTGNVFYSSDYGFSWIQLRNVGSEMIIFNNGKIYSVNQYSGLSVSSDSGKNWEELGPGGHYTYNVCTNGSTIILSSLGFFDTYQPGGLLISSDNGKTWTKYYGFAGSDIIAVGKSYMIATAAGPLLSLDNGISWKILTLD